MRLIKSLTVASFVALSSLQATASTQIQDPNYVCVHTQKPEALVFKTSTPQKIWKTSLLKSGEIKRAKAFELKKPQINAASINIEGKVSSFKAELTKDYEVKGLFEKQTDEDIRLVVISNYAPQKKATQRKDSYNCHLEKSDTPPILLGSIKE